MYNASLIGNERAEYDKQRKLKRKIDGESLTATDAEYVFCTV
jgi:hypothetical protein